MGSNKQVLTSENGGKMASFVKWLDQFFHSYYYIGLMLILSMVCWYFSIPNVAIFCYFLFVLADLIVCRSITATLPIFFVITFIFKERIVFDTFTVLYYGAMALAFMIVFAVFVIKKVQHDNVVLKKGRLFYPLALMMIISIFGGMFSPFYRIEYAFVVTMAWALVYFLYWTYLNFATAEDKSFLLRCIVFGAVNVIMQMLVYYVQADNLWYALTHKAVCVGIREINIPAVFIAMAIPTMFYKAVGSKRPYLYILLAVVFYCFVFLTYSRGVILIASAVAFICAIYIAIKDKMNRKTILYAYGYIISIFAILLAVLIITGKLNELFDHYISLGLGENGRYDVWKASFKLFTQYPVFGIGFYAENNHIMPSNNAFVMPHNTILQLLASSGLIGLLLSIPYFIVKYKVLIESFKTKFGFFALMVVCIPALYGLIDQTYLYITLTMVSIIFVALVERKNAGLIESIVDNDKEKNVGYRGIYNRFVKRLFDIVLSGIALIVFSPIMLVVAIISRIKLGKGVIFKQVRITKGGVPFKLYKFRTMKNAFDKNGNPLPDSQRVTKYGQALRKTSLDELPQLWNIFKGDMSIIGPRPRMIQECVFLDEDTARKRSLVRPGLSGWAQVNGRNSITFDKVVEYDKYYVEHVSFLLDIKILFMTIATIFKRKQVNKENTVSNEFYGDMLLRLGQITKEEYDAKQKEAKDIIDKVG